MSQHELPVNSARCGAVTVIVGYDVQAGEAFLSYEGTNDLAYISPSGLDVSQLQDLVTKRLGVALPESVIDAVQADVADLRVGADISRRHCRYDSLGIPIREPLPA